VGEWGELTEKYRDWSSRRKLPNPAAAEAARLVVGLGPRRSRPLWLRTALYACSAAAIVAALVILGTNGKSDSRGLEETRRIAKSTALQKESLDDAESKSSSTTAGTELPIKVVYSEQCELSGSNDSFAKELSVPGQGRLVFEIGGDRIGLGAESKVEILQADSNETRIKLGRGKVAVKIEPRKKRGSFSVEAGIFAVKAIGTRFEVSMFSSSRIEVSVDEGEVLVAGPGETLHKVKQGQALKLGHEGAWNYASLKEADRNDLDELLDPLSQNPPNRRDPGQKTIAKRPREKESPVPEANLEFGKELEPVRDLDLWRSLILDGRFERAERELEAYLEISPEDASAWLLLANCRRKIKNWEGAVDAYRRVIENGSPQTAASARFDAALILQDKLFRYREAAALYYEYLEAPLLLEAEAMVRLSRSLVKLNRDKEAREMLEQVVDQHKGTSAALEASRLLDGMGN
jgi:tetratricopeptide (TPR) repeat protein